MIVDTHLHLWDPDRIRYPWLADVPRLNRPYLLADYRAATAGIPIERMVFLQCECDPLVYRQEADWVTELAGQDNRIQGIVPWAPLEKGAGARAELAALAQTKLVKGIRRIIQFESDPVFCVRPDFVKGVQLLAEFDLHFEICIKGDEQFANTLQLVRQCPQTRFILDHIGKPFIKEQRIEPWGRSVRELAELPNVWCKISGLANEADLEHWQPADLQPYLDHVVACFGFDRVMFGGDWPVCTLATSYRRWFETLDAQYPAHAKRKLFHDNALKFYRLPH